MVDNYAKSLEVLFTGYMIKFTIVFSEIKRPDYGKGSDAFNKILECEVYLCCIPTGNACFRNYLEYFHKKDFSKKKQRVNIRF